MPPPLQSRLCKDFCVYVYHIKSDEAIKQGLYTLSGKTVCRKISWSFEAARFGSKLFQSLWNLAGTSAALLPRCLSNFRAIRPLQHTISRLRDFTRFGVKTSYSLVNRGPELDKGDADNSRCSTQSLESKFARQWFRLNRIVIYDHKHTRPMATYICIYRLHLN